MDSVQVHAKDSNLTLNIFFRYVVNVRFFITNNYSIRTFDQFIPYWVKNISLYMDNAGTNKNRYLIYIMALLIKKDRFNSVDLSFLLVGHTKVRSKRKYHL